jgi:hypothetical protein
MNRNDTYGIHFAFAALGASLLCLSLVTACGDSSEERMAADMDCMQIAASRSGYRPAGSDSSVGKGAAIGAAGGAVVGAVSSKKSKDVAKGAAIGAAAGAGAGALKDSEDRKKAEQARKTYDMEYQHCMKAKGF